MANGIFNYLPVTVHPAPEVGRVKFYVFDDGLTEEPYYMADDGIARKVNGISDHLQLSNIGVNSHLQIDAHMASNANPHNVTKANVGLGNVDNTSDALKPISLATQAALDLKQDILTKFRWSLQAGHANLPANGTEQNFSYGHNNANDGVTAIKNGVVEAMSVRLEPSAGGTATYIVTLNNVNNNVAGQRVVIDGNVGAEGEVSGESGLLIFAPPLAYSAGDQIEVRAITSGWANTNTDSTVMLRMLEDI